MDVRRNWKGIPYSICLRWVWPHMDCADSLGAHDFCWPYWRVFISRFPAVLCVGPVLNMTSLLQSSLVFVSLQVYVEVNKHAEHDEDLKQAARDFFRQLEQHESKAVSLWKQFRDITVDEYQHIYKVRPAVLWREDIIYPNKYNQLLCSVTARNLTFVLYLLAVRGPLWCLLRGVPSPRPSPGGGAAAAEPRTVENLRVGDSMCDGLQSETGMTSKLMSGGQ